MELDVRVTLRLISFISKEVLMLEECPHLALA